MKNHHPQLRATVVLLTALLLQPASWAANSLWSAGGGGNMVWSLTNNWSGSQPAPTNDIKFFDLGASSSISNINNIVDSSQSVQSFQFGETNNFHTTLINPAVTLTISTTNTGNALLMGTDNTNTTVRNITLTNTITGSGALVMTSANANLTVRQPGVDSVANRATLDMSGLNTFNGTLSRVLVGVGASGVLNRSTGKLYLAKTNTITTTGSAPQIDVGDSSGGSNNGSGSTMNLGQTNAIFTDSITIGRQRENGNLLRFNPAFTNNNPVAYFRGTNGSTSRVSAFNLGDAATQTGTITCRGTVDFNDGTLDALVDTMIVGQCSTGTGDASQTQGTFSFNAGTLDVNTLRLGSQRTNNAANVASTFNVNANATLVVNTALEMPRTAGGTGASATTAALNVNGGTVKVSGDITDLGGTSTLTLNSGLIDMQPPGDSTPGKIIVDTLNVGNGTGAAVITNASLINCPAITLNSGATIAGPTMIDIGISGNLNASGVTPWTLAAGQKLQGAGTVSGDVIQSSGAGLRIAEPGLSGTLNMGGNLTLNQSGSLLFDLSNDPTQVGGTNDLLSVSGTVTLAGTNDVSLGAFNGDFGTSMPYELITCSSLSGGDNTYFRIVGPVARSRRTFAFDTSAGNKVTLSIGGTPAASLIWVGDGVANTWALTGASNWNNGGMTDKFFNLDSVTFDDTGSAAPAINLTDTLVPGALVVSNSAKNYTFAGPGGISGNTGLIKLQSGSLTLGNSGTNDFIGPITLEGGTLTIAGSGSNLFSGPIAVGAGTTLAYNRNDNLTVTNTITGTGTFANQGTNVLTLAPLSTNNMDVAIQVSGGTLKAGNASVLGSGAAATTVAAGATLDVNGFYLGPEVVTISGWGVNSNGAIINGSGSVFPALGNVTLAADAAIGGPGSQVLGGNALGRWDIRLTGSGPTDPSQCNLSTGGQPYNLYKVGPNYVGICNVTVDSSLGNIEIRGGTLSIQYNTTSLGNPNKTLTVQAGATLDLFNITNVINKLITLNGDGTSTNLNNSSGTNFIIGPITLNGGNVCNAGGTSLTLGGQISGGGSLTKTGGSPLILTNANNSWSGGTTIAGGTLQVGDGLNNGSLPAQPVTDNGTLAFNFNSSGNLSFGNVISGNGGVQVLGGGTLTLTVANSYTNQTFINTTTGGALRISNGGALGDLTGNTRILGNTNGNGRLELTGDISVAEPLLVDCRQDVSVNAPAVLNVSGNNTLTGLISGATGGSDWNFQCDSGKLTVSGNFLNIATSSTRNLKLMGAGTGEWSGVISNSTGDTSLTAVIKTNSGTWTLSGANKYTGPTSVGGGTLVVNGSIAGGSVTVNSGATLSGSGTITAGVTVNSGGTLSPGNSIGTMTIFGSLGLHGTNVMEVNKSGATFTSDYIQGVSGLTYGGTLKIVATGDPLATGDTFKLYAAGLPSGAFANIDPPTPGNGLIWNTNYLITDGSLRVTTSVNPTPTNILTVVTSNKLDMSWPADHIGWDLQSNVVGVAASNSWFTIQGSATTNSVTVTVDPSKTNVFYRLHLTP